MRSTHPGFWLRLNSKRKANTTRQLLESDLDPELAACPFCASRTELSSPVMGVQRDPDVYRLECGLCGCTYASRMPTDEYVEKYYAHYYDGDERRTHINTARLSRQLAKVTRPRPGERLRILDFGGGDGGVALELVRMLGSQPSYVAVIDFNRVPHPNPPPGVEIEHFRHIEETAGQPGFDVVIASAVLEHVKPLRQTLDALLRGLAPAGSFYARTPYSVPLHLAARRVGVNFDTNYPAHLYDLGPLFWMSCLSTLHLDSEYALTSTRPSIVETEWRTAPLTTLTAILLKLPWSMVGNRYPWVGGWEVIVTRLAG
jgi:SAM-dependent methyltransferase